MDNDIHPSETLALPPPVSPIVPPPNDPVGNTSTPRVEAAGSCADPAKHEDNISRAEPDYFRDGPAEGRYRNRHRSASVGRVRLAVYVLLFHVIALSGAFLTPIGPTLGLTLRDDIEVAEAFDRRAVKADIVAASPVKLAPVPPVVTPPAAALNPTDTIVTATPSYLRRVGELIEQRMQSASKKSDPARLSEIASSAARLEKISSQKSMDELSEFFGQALGTRKRQLAPVNPPPAGPFDFDSGLPFEVRTVVVDGKEKKFWILVDKDGRSLEVELGDQNVHFATDAIVRMQSSPVLRDFYRKVFLPIVDLRASPVGPPVAPAPADPPMSSPAAVPPATTKGS